MFQTYITHFQIIIFAARLLAIAAAIRRTVQQGSRSFCTGLFHSDNRHQQHQLIPDRFTPLGLYLLRTSLLNREIRKYIYF